VAPNLNTASRSLKPTSLTREYEALPRTFGWGPKEFPHANLIAIEATFFDTAVKQKPHRAFAAAGVHDMKVVDSWEFRRVEEIRA
jgi:hypothetical protein